MTFEELKQKVESGELNIPIEIDEETGELLLDVDPNDEQAMVQIREFLASNGIELPSPEDFIDVHEGHAGGISLDMEEGDPELPEFDVMTFMVTGLSDDKMLDYVTDLVCGGICDMTAEEGPMALRGLGIELREDWDIDWNEVISTQDFEGRVRYLLRQFPADALRAVAETALKRAILVMIREGQEFANVLMSQMAAQIVVSNDPDDDDNPLLGT